MIKTNAVLMLQKTKLYYEQMDNTAKQLKQTQCKQNVRTVLHNTQKRKTCSA